MTGRDRVRAFGGGISIKKRGVNTCFAARLWSFSAGIIVQVGFAASMSWLIKANFGLP